jgi:glycosyltransferase involved in cell wall biosynthesis
MSIPRVNMLPLQAHCFAFGGFEIQMLELIKALELGSDVTVKKMNPWDRDSNFDVLHLWGLEQANYNNAFWAKKYNKKVVLTALIGQIVNLKESLRFRISSRIGNVRFLLELLEHVDALVVVNEREARKATDYFKVPKEKVYIIPNLITRAAKDSLSTPTDALTPVNNYLFCAGNISERKNQLMLAQVAHECGVNVVFAGDFVCSTSYKEEFLKLTEISGHLFYAGNLQSNSKELFTFFKNSMGFCLPSHQETQPISVLEAAFFGKNILIGNGPYAKQEIFRNLLKVDPTSFESLKSGVLKLISAKNQLTYSIDEADLNKCLYSNVAGEYSKIYSS